MTSIGIHGTGARGPAGRDALPLDGPGERREWLRLASGTVLVLILAASVAARFGLVRRHALWADELFSLAMATGHSLEHPAASAEPASGDFLELRQAAVPSFYSRYLEHEDPVAAPSRVMRAVFLSDTSPPLYYLLLYAWTRGFGTSDAAVRFFSVLCGVACFPVVWSIARQVGGRGARVPALVLFALSPLSVYYSTEGRMYALLWLCVVCTMWLTLALRRDGPRPALVAGWVIASAAGFWTHYFFLFAWAAAAGWLMLYPGRLGRKWLLASIAGVVVLVLPWHVRIPQSLAQWRVTGDWLNKRPGAYQPVVTELMLPWTFFTLHGQWGGVRPIYEWINRALFLGLAVCAVWRVGRRLFSVRRRLVWLWLIGPLAGLVAFDLLRHTYVVMNPRYALAGLPAAVLLVACVVGRLPRPARVVVTAALVVTCAVGIRRMYRNDSRNGQPYDRLAAFAAREAGQSDVIIVHSIPSGVTGIARQLAGRLPGEKRVTVASWCGQLGARRVPQDIEALADGRGRVIFVRVHDVGQAAPEEEWLREHGVVMAEDRPSDWSNVTVFEPRGGETFSFQRPTDR